MKTLSLLQKNTPQSRSACWLSKSNVERTLSRRSWACCLGTELHLIVIDLYCYRCANSSQAVQAVHVSCARSFNKNVNMVAIQSGNSKGDEYTGFRLMGQKAWTITPIIKWVLACFNPALWYKIRPHNRRKHTRSISLKSNYTQITKQLSAMSSQPALQRSPLISGYSTSLCTGRFPSPHRRMFRHQSSYCDKRRAWLWRQLKTELGLLRLVLAYTSTRTDRSDCTVLGAAGAGSVVPCRSRPAEVLRSQSDRNRSPRLSNSVESSGSREPWRSEWAWPIC